MIKNNILVLFLGILAGFLLIIILLGNGLLFSKLTNSFIDKWSAKLEGKENSRFAKISSNFKLSFESQVESDIFDAQQSGMEISPSFATEGKSSLLVEFPPNAEYPGISFDLFGKNCLDWKDMKEFSFDVFNSIDSPATLIVQIRSGEKYPKKQFKKEFVLPALKTATIIISRNNLEKELDLSKISHLTIFMNNLQTTFRLYFDNMKVVSNNK